MDSASVRTPTRSELNTFKVMSNLDFTDLTKPEPNKWSPSVPVALEEEPEIVRETVEQEWGGNAPKLQETEDLSALEALIEKDELHDERQIENNEIPSLEEPLKDLKDHNSIPKEPESRESSVTRRRAAHEAAMEASIEKEALLYELELMEKQGLIKLHRNLTMNNTLEEIQYQYDRTNMIVSTQQTVDWAKTGIKMGSSILEALMKKFGISVIEGFSNNLCKDMNKFNKPLTKMYRKYWRRGTSSPEMELAMIVFGALAMTVMGNKGLMGSKASEPLARPVVPDAAAGSALRPPSMNAFGNFVNFGPSGTNSSASSGPVVQQQKPTVVPEWARAALAGPLGPDKPQHFAKVTETHDERLPERPVERLPERVPERLPERVPERQSEPADSFPELNRDLQMPVMPVPVRTLDADLATKASQDIPDVRRLTLASPKSSRRRKEPVAELNLDD